MNLAYIEYYALLAQVDEVSDHALLEKVGALSTEQRHNSSISVVHGNTDSIMVVHHADDISLIDSIVDFSTFFGVCAR